MRRQKLIAALSLLGALALLVAACAPAATPTPTATPTPPPAAATPTPTPPPGVATPTPEAATPTPKVAGPPLVPSVPPPDQYGGILRRPSVATPTMWDSHRSISSSTMEFTAYIWNQLVRYPAFADYYNAAWIEPDLAERWEASADGTAHTFYLRKGVKFHDGAPFTAKDVKYSLEKLMDPNQSVFSVDFSIVDRVEIVDDYTVKVYLKFSSGMFLPLMAHGYTMMRAEHLKGVSYRSTDSAIGTGYFKFKSMTTGVEVSYEKNPDYFLKGRPYLDGLVIPILAAAASLNAFLGGRLDIGPASSEEDFQTLKQFAPEALISYQPFPVWRGLIFNFAKEGPWQDGRVRRAMVMVLDFPGASKAAVGDVPLADPYGGYFLGRGLPWSEYEKEWWLDRPLEARIAEAKRLLAGAGYANGFKGEIFATSTGRSYIDPTLLAQDLWKRYLNIDLSFLKLDRAASIERMERGAFDIAFLGVPSTTGEPEQVVTASYIPAGTSNFGKYTHLTITELYEKLRREPNPERRMELTIQMERLLMADIPGIPLYKATSANSSWPYLKNFIPRHAYHSHYTATTEILWFDKADPTWTKRR